MGNILAASNGRVFIAGSRFKHQHNGIKSISILVIINGDYRYI